MLRADVMAKTTLRVVRYAARALLGCAVVLTAVTLLAASPVCAAEAALTQREVTPAKAASWFKNQKRTVLTFIGYSGADYEDPDAMLAAATRILSGFDPHTTIVNIGGTAEGIGAVYEVAKRRGFRTTGIVSTQARANATPLSRSVDTVFFIPDPTWGGIMPGQKILSPTSQAMVASSDVIVAIGGGQVGRDEFLAARRAGKDVRFIAADMNHTTAIKNAEKKERSAPGDFAGALAAALAQTGQGSSPAR